ncbi:unnamed protein product [Lasius platythorax]|uniref:Uncharacterized protein n=1 Tax=Lasius platythorax TaxID=488582 RepID=A0AAV2P3R1_9HYME
MKRFPMLLLGHAFVPGFENLEQQPPHEMDSANFRGKSIMRDSDRARFNKT